MHFKRKILIFLFIPLTPTSHACLSAGRRVCSRFGQWAASVVAGETMGRVSSSSSGRRGACAFLFSLPRRTAVHAPRGWTATRAHVDAHADVCSCGPWPAGNLPLDRVNGLISRPFLKFSRRYIRKSSKFRCITCLVYALVTLNH